LSGIRCGLTCSVGDGGGGGGWLGVDRLCGLTSSP
jgi:hypothetical protein